MGIVFHGSVDSRNDMRDGWVSMSIFRGDIK